MSTVKRALKKAVQEVMAPATVLSNPYVNAFLTLFLILYASLARPQLPRFLANLFDNAFFRLLVLFGIAFMASRNIQVALLVAVAFTVTMNLLSEQKVVEGFLSEREQFE